MNIDADWEVVRRQLRRRRHQQSLAVICEAGTREFRRRLLRAELIARGWPPVGPSPYSPIVDAIGRSY